MYATCPCIALTCPLSKSSKVRPQPQHQCTRCDAAYWSCLLRSGRLLMLMASSLWPRGWSARCKAHARHQEHGGRYLYPF